MFLSFALRTYIILCLCFTLQAKKAANAFLKISEAIQHTLNQSEGFTDVLGEEDDEITQLVTTNTASKMAANPIMSNTSKVEMKGLAAFGGQSVKASVSITINWQRKR